MKNDGLNQKVAKIRIFLSYVLHILPFLYIMIFLKKFFFLNFGRVNTISTGFACRVHTYIYIVDNCWETC